MDPRQVDLLVAEIALVVQNFFTLVRYRYELSLGLTEHETMRLCNLGKLLEAIEVLLHHYATLEELYLERGVQSALAMTEITHSISTSVEDVFFILKKCLSRSVAAGEYHIIMAIIEGAKNVLERDFVPSLQRRARQLHPTPKTRDCIAVKIQTTLTRNLTNFV